MPCHTDGDELQVLDPEAEAWISVVLFGLALVIFAGCWGISYGLGYLSAKLW